MDAAHRELFTVNNDVEDRLVVFDYDARGNVKPKRLLYVPHQSWGIAFDTKRDEIALSVQTPNMYVVFKRDAQKIRSRRSARCAGRTRRWRIRTASISTRRTTRCSSPTTATSGRRELITSYTAYDARESRQERSGNAFSETARGRFVASSLTVYDGDAKGDAAPLRTISGPLSQIDWPMGVAVDEANNEIVRREQRRQLDPRVRADGDRQRPAEARHPRRGDRHQGADGRGGRQGRDLGRELRRAHGAGVPAAGSGQRRAAAASSATRRPERRRAGSAIRTPWPTTRKRKEILVPN